MQITSDVTGGLKSIGGTFCECMYI